LGVDFHVFHVCRREHFVALLELRLEKLFDFDIPLLDLINLEDWERPLDVFYFFLLVEDIGLRPLYKFVPLLVLAGEHSDFSVGLINLHNFLRLNLYMITLLILVGDRHLLYRGVVLLLL
jgi:hypothetical protein